MSGRKLSKVKKSDCKGDGKEWIVGKGCFQRSSSKKKLQSPKKDVSGKKLSKVKKADCKGDGKEWIVGKGCFQRSSSKKISPKVKSVKAKSPKVKSVKSKSPKVKVVKAKSPKVSKKESLGCVERHEKKYQERNSPSYSAQDCPGEILRGNDGQMYESRANKNGVYAWKLATDGAIKPRKVICEGGVCKLIK